MTDKTVQIEILGQLFARHFGFSPSEVTPIAGAGSNRRYFLLTGTPEDRAEKRKWQRFGGVIKAVGTIGEVLKENEAFIYLSRHFRSMGISCVPAVYEVSEDGMSYLQSYAGSRSVFEIYSSYPKNVEESTAGNPKTGVESTAGNAWILRAIQLLPEIQFKGAEGLDFSKCYPQPEMDSRMVRWDLNYFKYCFLKSSGILFDEVRLQDEFDRLESEVLRDMPACNTFMLRDFQSRNVMVEDAYGDSTHGADPDSGLTVIDFQGGRRGPVGYDVASLLWQSKADIPGDTRNIAISAYAAAAEKICPEFDYGRFREQLPHLVLFRVLQTLGAYGFRGWVEKKPHFLASIEAGTRNLRNILTDRNCGIDGAKLGERYPVLRSIALKLVKNIDAQRQERAEEDALGLTVEVGSFSYKKGLPEDRSGNGGGFIFDCRATHNPGRYDEYKQLTGRDPAVIEFLENDGEILKFLDSCYKLVDASVERYLERGFTHLSVYFGCTGGRHRSVYSADAMARHLHDKYGVRIRLNHRERGIREILVK